jgi:hypothetical protein
MKTCKTFLFLGLLFYTQIINSQEKIAIDSLIKNLRLDFAVPDLPAFNALQSEPSSILRPSSPKEFSVIADEFFNGKNIIIPKSFAAEIAPIVIARYNKLTLRDYQKHPIIYNSRISIGTLRDSLNTSHIAIGFRTTLINKGDIKSDKNLRLILDDLQKRNKGRNEYYDRELQKLGKDEAYFADHPELQTKFSHEFDSIYNSSPQNIKDYKENKFWNAEKLDIAISLVGSSQDSIAKNIKFNSLLAWITYARPIGKNGQILGGLSLNSYKKDNQNYFDFSLQSRLYIGINQLKSFAECQYLYKNSDKTNNLIFRIGCEYYLYNGIWVDFNAGMYKDLTKNISGFVSSFRLIYALPGNFK